jgi:chromosome segregation ATPase
LEGVKEKGNNMEQRREHEEQAAAPEADPAATGLDLVERTAELIRATEDHAAGLVARSEAAVAHLQEEMRLAERVLEAAETRRRVAEAEVKELMTKLEETEQKFQERIDSLSKTYQDRIEALNGDLLVARMHGTRQEERANEAESALSRIQNAMEGILKVRAND